MPLGRRHRGYLERLPDAVHVPLVLSHGPQDKGAQSASPGPLGEPQGGAVARPWSRVGDGTLEPGTHAPGCGGGATGCPSPSACVAAWSGREAGSGGTRSVGSGRHRGALMRRALAWLMQPR